MVAQAHKEGQIKLTAYDRAYFRNTLSNWSLHCACLWNMAGVVPQISQQLVWDLESTRGVTSRQA